MRFFLCFVMVLAFISCVARKPPLPELAPDQQAVVSQLGLNPLEIRVLEQKPLYEFTELELDHYLAYVHATVPNLRDRVMKFGRKNIGQPYEIFLLGEFPYELYDPQPLYSLQKSDCVVFAEHTYAMALSRDWPSFFQTLQAIRYHNGEISVFTRNHYTEADWNVNNQWLVQDITHELAPQYVQPFSMEIDRQRFFKTRYGLDREIPKQLVDLEYLPYDKVESIKTQLQPGDFVNVIVGKKDDHLWATHVGLVAFGPDGTLHFLHSAKPQVREEPFSAFIQRYLDNQAERLEKDLPTLRGFKFLRLVDAPKVSVER
ncbi:MAG: DUF1460 domain-containing protein [Acidobacteria bacterium]|nr:DUF1460 domain-containing protein [Acidobacteriota bacterium]